METTVLPSPLSDPDICCLQEVADLFYRSAIAWDVEDLSLFVKLLAEASSLDYHDIQC